MLELCFKCLAHWIKFSAEEILKYFLYISQKTGFDISCKLSPVETFCMKCPILFSGKKKKNIINLSSAENAQRVEKVKCHFRLSILALDKALFLARNIDIFLFLYENICCGLLVFIRSALVNQL